ncbi:hypothetical protein V1956_18950 [Yersinia sp. 2540 StPb PI]|uniref:hypothetical protein n=1 Tax=Yersinia sp. 2540 StPb PI TaxID=3117406 RepID=UPI003FA451B5
MSGDQARESVKQVTSNLKDQVRDKLGEGTLSAIVNSIINATAGHSSHFQLFRVGNARLSKPVASNQQLAVLPYPICP